MKLEDQFLTKSKFTKLIQGTVAEMKIPYMDAILLVCEKNDIEIDDIRKFISPVIKDKLEAEAMDLNFLPKKNCLNHAGLLLKIQIQIKITNFFFLNLE